MEKHKITWGITERKCLQKSVLCNYERLTRETSMNRSVINLMPQIISKVIKHVVLLMLLSIMNDQFLIQDGPLYLDFIS